MAEKSSDAEEEAGEKERGDSEGPGPGNGGKSQTPVVGLGASAGGLKALKRFFSAVPADSGLAYIVVVHLASNRPSMMPELLQEATPVTVTVAGNGDRIEPDHVYVVPPNHEIGVEDEKIVLLNTRAEGSTIASIVFSGPWPKTGLPARRPSC